MPELKRAGTPTERIDLEAVVRAARGFNPSRKACYPAEWLVFSVFVTKAGCHPMLDVQPDHP